jgi:hypothetical protein
MARPIREQGKLSCDSSLRTLGGIAVATARPLPGRCADMAREISPVVLPDVARPSRDRLAGLRAAIGELLASRKNLVLTRGKACLCLKMQISDQRLNRDLKIIASDFSRFVNATVQIDGAICDAKLNVLAFSFLRVRLASPDCRE